MRTLLLNLPPVLFAAAAMAVEGSLVPPVGGVTPLFDDRSSCSCRVVDLARGWGVSPAALWCLLPAAMSGWGESLWPVAPPPPVVVGGVSSSNLETLVAMEDGQKGF